MKISFVTFRGIDSWIRSPLEQKQPSVFNGIVRVKRYRVTVEEIEETKEVLRARLQELWDTCDNLHYMKPLRDAAFALGVEINRDTWGKKRNQKKT